MKPENNGRHCSSCAKLVVDFTEKTDLEIKNILIENAGKKTCGRFRKNQINRPLAITLDVTSIIQSHSSHKIFIAALLLAFGTGLFSCYDHQDKKIQIERINITGSEFSTGEVVADPPMLGGLQVSEENADTLDYGRTMTGEANLSDIAQPSDNSTALDSLKCQKNSEDSIEWVLQESDVYTTGVMAADVVEETFVPPTNSENTNDSLGEESIKLFLAKNDNSINATAAEVLVYPNPASGQFTLKYTIEQKCDVSAEIFDQQGRKLMQLIDIKSQHTGEYHIPFDLSLFGPDLYELRLRLSDKQTTIRLVVQR